MSELKEAILDARYIDMISLGDFVVRDCGLPDVDADGNLMPQAAEIAAAIFRWAADVEASAARTPPKPGFEEYDDDGDPLMDAETAEKLEAEQGTKDEDK